MLCKRSNAKTNAVTVEREWDKVCGRWQEQTWLRRAIKTAIAGVKKFRISRRGLSTHSSDVRGAIATPGNFQQGCSFDAIAPSRLRPIKGFIRGGNQVVGIDRVRP